MDDSLYDSFRWLDEDTDLDLSLDNYQQRAQNSPACLPPRRRPSFRRTLSLNSVNLSRRSISLASYGKIPISSPLLESQPTSRNTLSRRSSVSRPSTRNKPRHTSQSSTSSIDPSAQYFHDPEARLKLRVYLASPQKFDEAIEFGFPALKDNGPVTSMPFHPNPSPQIKEFTGTFLDDGDDASIRSEKKERVSTISRLSYVMEGPQDNHSEQPTAKLTKPMKVPLLEPKRSREMTLRMTLTRPDLRDDSCPTPTSTTDPASPHHLSLADDNSDFWEQETDDQSLMKKMWRKFRRRKE
ncbi:hypothetical protein BJX63DRAFT_434827 [Aspergillus granulosus]|uniref:Mucin n=1 Tax=Aspergillus granulosus TaxID=176169 RepID=A0ABR4H360_9EURO